MSINITPAPMQVSQATRDQYMAEKHLWPCVSKYKTLKQVEQRLQSISKNTNEYKLLRMKRFILNRPKSINDSETRLFAFIRFIWGSAMAMAETPQEKAGAREEETMLLLEVWKWFESTATECAKYELRIEQAKKSTLK